MQTTSSGDFQIYKTNLEDLIRKNASEEVCREKLMDPFFVSILGKKCVINADERDIWNKFKSAHSLSYSARPDLILGSNSSKSLLEAKIPSQDLNQRKFRVEGAKKLIQLYEAEELTEEEIKGISEFCNYYGHLYKRERGPYERDRAQKYWTYCKPYEINAKIANKLQEEARVRGCKEIAEGLKAVVNKLDNTLKVGPQNDSEDAGILFTVPFKNGNLVELYQQDWYILDLYFVFNLKSVILINGKCAKRWFKGSLEPESYNLTDEEQFNRFKEDLKNDLP